MGYFKKTTTTTTKIKDLSNSKVVVRSISLTIASKYLAREK